MTDKMVTQMSTLADESYQIVNRAISHAKEKGHSQVQPLHVAAALLEHDTRSPDLHNACLQSQENPSHPPHPLKCEALDLCFKVALDRLAVVTDPEKCKDQAMSNALGAALKRAHANERRCTPEQSLQPLLAVKTGIAHLTISILDDPSVSRVFREAGFSSTAVKTIMEEYVSRAALIKPPPSPPLCVAVPHFTTSRPDNVKFFGSYPALGRPLDNSAWRPAIANNNEGEVSKIVDTLFSGAEKRNPVLVSDSGLNFVLKEFSQRLRRGNLPRLSGVQCLDFPFTSLSVGIISEEYVLQKMEKLKMEVDGCISTGGAIISVGDLRWLLEPSHSISSFILQELQKLMSINAPNRLWLLGSASPETFERFRSNGHPSLDSLGLHPVKLTSTSDNSASAPQSRFGSYSTSKNGTGRMGGAKAGTENPVSVEHGLDCCPECSRNFQQECAVLVKEEQNLSLRSRCALSENGSSLSENHYQLHRLQNHKDKTRAPLPVKEEEDLLTQRIREIRNKWQQQCSAHQLSSRGSSPGGPGVVHESMSPVAEVVSPQERDSRPKKPMYSLAPASRTWVPQPAGNLFGGKSAGLAPLHARMSRGNLASQLCSAQPAFNSANREGRDESSGGPSPLKWMRGPSVAPGIGMNMKPSSLLAPIRTELALGRTSIAPAAAPAADHRRDLREEGQFPLRNKVQLPSNLMCRTGLSSATDRSSDAENLIGLRWKLSNSVAWQKEAVGNVAETVTKCRSGLKTGAAGKRTDTWLMFLGPDRVGKREIAKALARLVFGPHGNFILETWWQPETARQSNGCPRMADSNGVEYRGKTRLDRLAGALARKPFSVVLLEDVDRADNVTQSHLLKAMDKGRLRDSSGKETSLANVIVIMTCGAGASLLAHHGQTPGHTAVEFDEEKLSELSPREVNLIIDDTSSQKVLYTKGTGLSIVDSMSLSEQHQRAPEDTVLIFGSNFKQKADDRSSCTESPRSKRCKREGSSPGKSWDLNRSAEENLSDEEPSGESSVSQRSEEPVAKVIDCAQRKFSKEMFAMFDQVVVFKPFNLVGLTDWVFGKLESSLEDVMRTTKAPVEIDRALLEVMVSSAWQNFSTPDEFPNWVDEVLMKAVSGVLGMIALRPDSVVKLSCVENATGFEDRSSFLGSKAGLLPKIIRLGQ